MDMGRIFEPECILQCYEDEHNNKAVNNNNAAADDEEDDDDAARDSEEAECTATDLSMRPRSTDFKMEVTAAPAVASSPPAAAEMPENLSLAAMRAVANASREYTVTWKELEPLFRFCSRCGAPVEKTRHSLHSVLSVSAVCQRGHGVFWTSRS